MTQVNTRDSVINHDIIGAFDIIQEFTGDY